MRILITTDWYIPAVNGVVSSVLALMKGLEERGHEVKILTLSQQNRSYTEGNVLYQAAHNCSFVYQKARFSLRMDKSILRRILDWKPDVIHSQCEFSTFRMARKISERCGAPIIHTFHTDYEHYTRYCFIPDFLGKGFSRFIYRYAAKRSSALIVPSSKTERLVAGYGISKMCFVVPSGVDLQRFSSFNDSDRIAELCRQHNLDDGSFRLLFVGRVAKEKNIDELLSFMAALSDLDIKLIIAGDGPYMPDVKELSEKLGLGDKVVFAGMIPPENIQEYYHLSDAFVIASTSETQGLCLVEALASSLPVICRHDPVVDGVIANGFNGFQYSDQDEFRAAVSYMLADRNRLNELKNNARKTAERYSVPSFAEIAEDIYRISLWAEEKARFHCPMRWEITR